MKKWRQLAEEKSKLDEQTEEIHQKFKMDKIKKRVWSAFRRRVF